MLKGLSKSNGKGNVVVAKRRNCPLKVIVRGKDGMGQVYYIHVHASNPIQSRWNLSIKLKLLAELLNEGRITLYCFLYIALEFIF